VGAWERITRVRRLPVWLATIGTVMVLAAVAGIALTVRTGGCCLANAADASTPTPTAGDATTSTGTATPGATATPTGPRTTTPAARRTTTTRPPAKPGAPPANGTVRVFWLRPSDVAFDRRIPDGIAKVMREAQRYYRQELGRTFALNAQVVEVVVGEHERSWYENTPNGGDKYWWSVSNMANELRRRLGLRNPDSRWLIVGEVSAEGEGAGGGGSPGWVVLSEHDALGAAGLGNASMNRWYGGMVHELGHAFGLPDATSTDGTPMSASFYSYPNTHFSEAQKSKILSGRYAGFLS
jgi:hypothetical protein